MADKPGHFDCEIEGYSGYIEFPHPMTWTHVRYWWQKVVETLKDKARLDFEYTDVQWQGARDLVIEYGQWALKGDRVTVGDAKDNDVPAAVVTWVIESAEAYIVPFLHPRLRRMLSTTIL